MKNKLSINLIMRLIIIIILISAIIEFFWLYYIVVPCIHDYLFLSEKINNYQIAIISGLIVVINVGVISMILTMIIYCINNFKKKNEKK